MLGGTGLGNLKLESGFVKQSKISFGNWALEKVDEKVINIL